MARSAKKTATVTDVRNWAQAQGIQIGARGRIPAGTIAAFEKANRVQVVASQPKTVNAVAGRVRTWAQAQGKSVGDRGRIPRPVLASYFIAQPRDARQVAMERGVDAPSKGRISADLAHEIASTFN